MMIIIIIIPMMMMVVMMMMMIRISHGKTRIFKTSVGEVKTSEGK